MKNSIPAHIISSSVSKAARESSQSRSHIWKEQVINRYRNSLTSCKIKTDQKNEAGVRGRIKSARHDRRRVCRLLELGACGWPALRTSSRADHSQATSPSRHEAPSACLKQSRYKRHKKKSYKNTHTHTFLLHISSTLPFR